MKINKNHLLKIIKEELFYRDFYSDSALLSEQPQNIISPRVQGITRQIEKLEAEEQLQLFDILRPMMPPPG
jgi:hypothetical protein|tara:strand:- start:4853 stop:5065 length:213 start_codon:yes stop_codon:yes gene_type:complete